MDTHSTTGCSMDREGNKNDDMSTEEKWVEDNCWVCLQCGNKYLEEQGLKPSEGATTAHQGKCKVCREDKMVVHERSYKWLYHWRNKKQ